MGNVDGFGIHPGQTSGTGNVVAGCRAWFNSDDGYDCINSRASATFSNCWAFYNGYFTNFANSGGDGHGFKSGGYALNGTAPPNPVPRHVTEFCLAVSNRVSGFNANYQPNGLDWFNNTGYRNDVNYDMQGALTNNLVGIPGNGHLMRNNLGFSARSGTEIQNLGATNDTNFNYFSLPVTVTGDDFMSFDVSLLKLPRQTNGDLPYIAFMQLVSSSDLLDAGTNAGFAFVGVAPDLGAFEYAIEPPPTLVMAQSGSDAIFTGSSGPAGGTNYLIASMDLTVPYSSWPRVLTNKFDLTGNYAITNPISADVAQQFYRISLP
jgi:pectate lyase